jgi:hypothetical protein
MLREKKIVAIVFMRIEKRKVLNELKALNPNKGYFGFSLLV